MGKIIELPTKTKNLLDFIDTTKEILKKENVDNLLVVAKDNEGEIMIGKTGNVDINTLLEFNAHIQMYATDKMIQSKYLE